MEMTENKENKVALKSKIAISDFSLSRVDIIIPMFGQEAKAVQLIKSILVAIRSNPYQITLIDNGTPSKEEQGERFIDQFKDFDKSRPPGTKPILQTFRSDKNLGFGGAINFALKQTVHPWVLVIHSDCVVKDAGFMVNMGRSLLALKNSKVRMVGAKASKISAGDVRCRSSSVDYEGKDIILDQDNFLPLHCFMAHRELFSRIGGLKEYAYTGYEDEELALRMQYHGYKQAICGKAWIEHEGSGTMKDLMKKDPEVFKAVEGNRERCVTDLQQLYNKK